jgi:hypothetical protein
MIAKNIGVDSGTIIIADMSYFEDAPKQDFQLMYKKKVEKGNYEVDWYIKNTWNGEIEGSGELYLPTGNLIISDPCYMIDGMKWSEWLDKTEFAKKPDKGTIIIDSMGGDGCYKVEYNLKEVI